MRPGCPKFNIQVLHMCGLIIYIMYNLFASPNNEKEKKRGVEISSLIFFPAVKNLRLQPS
jgi:hypothetical protein